MLPEDLDPPQLERVEDLPEWEDLLDMARVCIAGRIQPSEYKALTDAEREAFVEVINQANRDK